MGDTTDLPKAVDTGAVNSRVAAVDGSPTGLRPLIQWVEEKGTDIHVELKLTLSGYTKSNSIEAENRKRAVGF